MKQIEFRRWEVRSSASSGALLIGELFFPLNKERNELESDSNESDNGSLKREKKKKAVRSSRERIASPSGINQPLLPRFRYSSEWIESGFALGADLPLENGIKLPSRGKKLFGFLADRALSPQSGSIFQSAQAAGSKVMDGSEAMRAIWKCSRSFSRIGMRTREEPNSILTAFRQGAPPEFRMSPRVLKAFSMRFMQKNEAEPI